MARLRGGKRPQVDWRKFLLPPGCVTLLAPIGPPGGEGVVYEALVTLPQPAARPARPAGAAQFTTPPAGHGSLGGAAAGSGDADGVVGPPASSSSSLSALRSGAPALGGPRGSEAATAAPSSPPFNFQRVTPLPRACDPRLDIGDYLTPGGAVRPSMVEEFALMCSTVQDPRQRWTLLQILRESQARIRWGSQAARGTTGGFNGLSW